MGEITEKDVVIILKEQSLMTEAYVIDKFIKLIHSSYSQPLPHAASSFVEFVLSFGDRNIGELVKRINDVINVNYMPAVNYIKQNIK